MVFLKNFRIFFNSFQKNNNIKYLIFIKIKEIADGKPYDIIYRIIDDDNKCDEIFNNFPNIHNNILNNKYDNIVIFHIINI